MMNFLRQLFGRKAETPPVISPATRVFELDTHGRHNVRSFAVSGPAEMGCTEAVKMVPNLGSTYEGLLVEKIDAIRLCPGRWKFECHLVNLRKRFWAQFKSDSRKRWAAFPSN